MPNKGGVRGHIGRRRIFVSTRETLQEVASRLGITKSAVLNRLRAGRTERQALETPKNGYNPRGKRRGWRPRPPRPGVKISPLTKTEVATLRLLRQGLTPRKIFERGLSVSLRALWGRLDRMRLKLNAFTNEQMMVKAMEEGLIK